ncbi:MAG: hypothetical protein LBJ87_05540 [bacterium]|jgi:hypothetical protein|nr:hypothetical protein [bacterium]
MSVNQAGVAEAIRAMADAVRPIQGLNVFDYEPSTVSPPAAVFGPPDTIDQFERLGPGQPSDPWRWPCPVELVGQRTNERSAQYELLALQREVVWRVEQLRHNRVCHVHVRAIGSVRPLQIAGGSYWSSRITFEVWA